MDLRSQLILLEGRRNKAYPDQLTGAEPWTCGVGATGPDVGPDTCWTDQQIDARLDADIAEKTAQCRQHFPWLDSLNEPRKAVIIGMCFQMGIRGLLGFKRMLDSVRDEKWANAANEMRTSRWAKQTSKRAHRLAAQMESGEWN